MIIMLQELIIFLLISNLCRDKFVISSDVEEHSSTIPTTDDDDWDEEDSSEIDDDSRIYKNPRNSPSTLCPRDEEQATLLNQKCLRKCSSDEDCKSKKKKCLCDGACGMSCIKPDRECPEPEQISLGSVTSSGRLFGARATYTCQHGYHVVGLQSRNCQADGQWAGSPPACKQNIYCLSPPTIDHARHNALSEQTTFDLDSTLQYYCHTGYVTNGFPRAKCLAIDGQASWYGPDISCEPRSCGPPIDISNGWHAGECYTFGCRITYHCADGFELVGRNERFCQSDGTWSPKELPTCVSVQCPPPENPRHGKAIYTSCSYNSVVSYECKYGYTLVGETTRRCGADKKWSGAQPQCKEINCGHPGRLWNGWLESIESGTGLGASIIFRCHEGMRLEGKSSTVCQIDGKWSYPLPKCLAPCVVPQVSQGRVILLSRNDTVVSSTVVQDGESLTVDCNQHYEFFMNYAPVECNNGTWTHIPKCQPARCKHLPKPPKNGMIIAPKMEHGMKALFKCRDGFEVKGNLFIECSFGNWTGEFPICQEVYCPFPGLVDNGKILLVGNMGLYEYRAYVRKIANNKQIMYDCDKGFVLSEGPPGATCVGGSWSPRELPKCTPGQHPRLRWSRKKRKAPYPVKREVSNPVIKERTDWYYFLTKILHTPKRMIKRIVKRALRTGSGSSSSRALGLGLKNRGNQPNARRKNKQVNNDVKIDKKKMCPPFSDDSFSNIEILKYGFDASISFSSGTILNITCTKGFGLNLAENSTVKCVRGKWRPAKPKCLLSPCVLPKILNGEYLSGYRSGLTIANGSSIIYQCHKENKKPTLHSVSCILGELDPKDPDCNIAYNTVLNVSKDTPYYLGGSDIVKGGDINALDYGNNKKSCASPTRGQGSLVYRNGELMTEAEEMFPDGSEVIFSCIESVVFKKTTWKIICDDGNWIGKPTNCDTEELLSLKNVNNTCIFRNDEPNVVSFYNDQKVTSDIVEYPKDTILVSRCVDIGKFSMTGTNLRKCVDGEWDNPRPICTGLNQYHDYSMEKAPTILFRYESGPVAQSNEGKLIVYPGVVLHMECLWMRRFGFPKWTVSHEFRQYPQNWTTDAARDSQLEYRLTIDHATKEDSGVFTCVTPARYTHSIEIEVKAIHCPGLPKRRGLTSDTDSTKMNTHIKFHCENGSALIGTSEVICLPSGNWSNPFPICESIECGEVGGVLPAHLKVALISRDVGGRATFSCSPGFGLSGPAETTCLSTGEWSLPFPNCTEVQCDTPGVPEHGYIQGTGPFKAGDVVQYNCNSDFMMDGQPIIACQDNGRWSGRIPKCIQACSYPGTIISGRMSAVKFYYKIGENITFSCDEHLLLNGAAMLKCLKNGKWSNTIPTCVTSPATEN